MHWLFLFFSPPSSLLSFLHSWTQPWLFIVYDSISNLSSRSVLLVARWFCSYVFVQRLLFVFIATRSLGPLHLHFICLYINLNWNFTWTLHCNHSFTSLYFLLFEPRMKKWACPQTEAGTNLANSLFLSGNTCLHTSSPQSTGLWSTITVYATASK